MSKYSSPVSASDASMAFLTSSADGALPKLDLEEKMISSRRSLTALPDHPWLLPSTYPVDVSM